jgi:hypothetical protein
VEFRGLLLAAGKNLSRKAFKTFRKLKRLLSSDTLLFLSGYNAGLGQTRSQAFANGDWFLRLLFLPDQGNRSVKPTPDPVLCCIITDIGIETGILRQSFHGTIPILPDRFRNKNHLSAPVIDTEKQEPDPAPVFNGTYGTATQVS